MIDRLLSLVQEGKLKYKYVLFSTCQGGFGLGYINSVSSNCF